MILIGVRFCIGTEILRGPSDGYIGLEILCSLARLKMASLFDLQSIQTCVEALDCLGKSLFVYI